MDFFIRVNLVFEFIFFNWIIFSIAFFSATIFSSNFIRLLVNVELMVLVSNLNFIAFSFLLDDLVGQIIVVFVLAVIAAESAIGLALFILYYRVYKTISIYSLNL